MAKPDDDAATADLMSLGRHCSVASCKQIDFLPFSCDACGQSYCLEHRTYAAHACRAAGSRTTEVIVCPICARGVRLNGREPNAAFEEHSRSEGCDPANWARVNRKQRCPVPGCKEKLTTISTYGCKKCGQRVCLKHRLEDDHGCAAVQGMMFD
jgi:predicted nucleic acid binding AN1-type Zn finger protein